MFRSKEQQFDFYWKEIFTGLAYNPIEFNTYRFDQTMSLPGKVNKLYDMFKQLALNNQEVMDYLKTFIETFDFKLESTVSDILIKWREDGFLAEIMLQITGLLEEYQQEVIKEISSVKESIDNVEQEHLKDLLVVNERIQLLIDYINNLTTSFENYKTENDTKTNALNHSIVILTSELNKGLAEIYEKINSVGSFEVVDVVETINELNTKYPQGVEGIVYVNEDDSWYVYNNGWQKGGTFGGNSNVNLKNLLFAKSLNLYDVEKATKGMYVDYRTGRLDENSVYNVTHFIPVTSGKTYYLSNSQQVAFYTGSNQESYHSGVEVASRVLIPSSVNYIRTNTTIEQSSFFYFGLYNPHPETYKPKISANALDEDLNKVIDGVKNAFRKSKNIFNPTKVTMGKYVSWKNGVLDDNKDYCVTDYIMLEPNTTYYKNDNQQCAFYTGNRIGSYVGGMEEGNFFTTDSMITFVRITIPINKLNTFMFAKSDKEIPFEPYGYYLGNTESTNKINIISPFDNFNAVISGLENNKTVYLMDGEYNTVLNIKNFKSNVVGLTKEKVFIQNTNNDYNKAPLITSGNGTFENIIFHAKTNGLPTQLPPYAAHIDYEGEGVLTFNNCDFISDTGQGIGIGFHNNQTIIFNNCRFYGKSNAFYAHCNIDSKTVNQKLICNNCYFYSDEESAIKIDDSNQIFGDKTNTTLVVEFISCLFNQKDYTKSLFHATTPPITGVTGNIRLSDKSCGNNITAFNNNKLTIDRMLYDYENTTK